MPQRAYDRFAWLFSPSGAVPEVAIGPEDLGPVADLLLGCWQILPVTLPRFSAWAGHHGPAQAVIERARARMLADGAVLDLQFRILNRLAAALRTRGVPFVLLKSAAVRLVAYDDPRQRRARDIDIGVARPDIDRAVECLIETGFESAQWLEDAQTFEVADLELRVSVESKHHELGFWVRLQQVPDLGGELHAAILQQRNERPAQWDLTDDQAPGAFIVADIHHGLSLDIPVDDVVASAQPAPGDGGLSIPRGGWMLFHLVFKLYIEGIFNYCEGAYQYADLCRLVSRMGDDELLFFATQIDNRNMRAAGYYVLRRLPSDFGVPLPPRLASLVTEWASPDLARSPTQQNDWGDMWPKLWGGR